MTTWTPVGPIGPELVTNGGFVGSAAGWTLGSNWAYGSNSVIHSTGPVSVLSQSILITAGQNYQISFNLLNTDLITSMGVFLGGAQLGTVSAIDTYTFEGFAGSSSTLLEFSCSDIFELTDISVRAKVGTSWTDIPKPTGATSVLTGYAYGLLMAITRPQTSFTDDWTRITSPSTTWTTIPKP